MSSGNKHCSSHGLRNELSIFLKWLHRLIQCSRLCLRRDEKYFCLVDPGERGRMLSSQILMSENSLRIPWVLGGGMLCCKARVLHTQPACEKALSPFLTPASRRRTAKGDGSSCLRSPAQNYTIYWGNYINRLTGTDGIRVLCHQFIPSSLSRRETCLTSSPTFWLKRNKLGAALLRFYSIAGHGREIGQMGDPLQHSRR
jgi:hypothetical protein